jgi:hypothetical protein
MTTDNRMTWGFIIDVLDLLEHHGYHKHAGQAVVLIHHLARAYEGNRDASQSTYLYQAPPSLHPEPRQPDQQTDPEAFILTGTDISTVLSALHMAAYDKRSSAEMCADCGDLSCPTCQYRLQAARAYDQLTARILQPAEAQPALRDHPEPGSSSLFQGQTDCAAGIEAGQ